MKTRVIKSITLVRKQQWNNLVEKDNPFTRYEFLKALEVSGSVGEKSGWIPHYIIAEQDDKLVGAIPLYLKYNSLGEYIFDWRWLGLYEQFGINYFPKFVIAVPFTPATGKRILVDSEQIFEDVAGTMLHLLMEEAQKKVSSIHWLFITEFERSFLEKHNFIPRSTYQYHWHNENYQNFDHFLQKFKAKKRNQIKRERRVANEVDIEIRSGKDLDQEHWENMYEFYLMTIGKKWAYPYLTVEFFDYIAKNFCDQVVMILAKKNGSYVAGSLNFRSGQQMYGRYWGCTEKHYDLHFELCYYQSIDYCIRNNIILHEAGAQGQHKICRGYLPHYTYSAHWIKDPAFSQVISTLVLEENKIAKDDIAELAKMSPFRNESTNNTSFVRK
ncbi:GNAT family N-acetyltransferase [Candidatus Uabimicrobium sp. HlEnr_7]|uniref:GNAT family N-acetyltransferase n=1 Tax=Candidatus Uabimicrobium helgolandensis TaxID=3095367 RepID=UPI0035571046